MRYQRFSLFGSWGANPWAKVHQKGKWPRGLRGLPACKISSLYVNPRLRYPLPKFLRTEKQKNKQTVTDISTACLSACVDNEGRKEEKRKKERKRAKICLIGRRSSRSSRSTESRMRNFSDLNLVKCCTLYGNAMHIRQLHTATNLNPTPILTHLTLR